MRSCVRIAALGAVLVLFLGGDAWAWGPGTHIFQGDQILRNLGLLFPAIAALIKRRSGDFLYGSLAPDFFLIKGSRRREGHIHDWKVGARLLQWARTDAQRAFAYGYLTHLAADVVSHNFYVPNQIYRSSWTERFGHLYWEVRADQRVRPESWQLARDVALSHFKENDELLRDVLSVKYLFYRANRSMYVRYFRTLHKGMRLGRAIRDWDRWWRQPLAMQWVNRLQETSVSVAVDLLRNPNDSIAYRYDPAGIGNIHAAKGLRRAAILSGKPREREKLLFGLPTELLALHHRSSGRIVLSGEP
jgi:hypothetical protein